MPVPLIVSEARCVPTLAGLIEQMGGDDADDNRDEARRDPANPRRGHDLEGLPDAHRISVDMTNTPSKRDRLLRKLLQKRKARRRSAAASPDLARVKNTLTSLLGSELLVAVEEWQQSQPAAMTIEEAVRRLVECGLMRDEQ
jgi:hypothetical protein